MFPRRMNQQQLAAKLTFESLMEAAGDMVLRADGTGQIFYASQRALAMAGAAVASGSALFSCVAAEDRPLFETALAEARDSLGNKRLQARLNAPEGPHWCE